MMRIKHESQKRSNALMDLAFLNSHVSTANLPYFSLLKPPPNMRLLPICLLLLNTALSAQITFEARFPAFLDTAAYLNGVSWIDVDNDNDLDVCVSGIGGTFPNNTNPNAIFINQGNGVFENTGLITSTQKDGMRHGWADVDNDGELDVYFGATWNNGGVNELWINNGGTSFTLSTGTGATPNTPQPYEGTVSWADYNNDGFVDLFVARWNNLKNVLYKSNGDGTWSTVSTGTLVTDLDWTSGGFWGDYDNDRDLDLYVINYQTGDSAPGINDLFRNNNDGTFTKITSAGPAVTDAQNTRSANWVDANNDGLLDLFVCNQFGQNLLHLNLGNGTFGSQPVGSPGSTAWSSNWGDFDNDGDQDLITIGFWDTESRFYQNNGFGSLTDITNLFPNIFPLATNGSNSNGVIFVDEDSDGWLDLHITQPGPGVADYFFHNLGVPCKSWLEIKLTGTESNRAAIGATVRAKTNINGTPVWQMRQVSAQTSATGQNPQWQHFGFDQAAVADTLIVEWPSGAICVFTQFALNRLVEIVEDCSVNVLKEATPVEGSTSLLALCAPASDTLLTPPSGPGGSWTANCDACITPEGLLLASLIDTGSYTLFYSQGGICGTIDTLLVTLASPPNILAMGDTTVYANEPVQLSVSGADTYTWTPSNGLSCTDCDNPVFTADTTTTFTATGANDTGCQGTDTVRVVVLPEPIFVMPNAFTPDGDGTNDVFNAVFEGEIFEQYTLAVYNRWGQKVFSSTRPTEGWNGKDAPSDVYVYVFDYLLIDGKNGQEKGEMTLVK